MKRNANYLTNNDCYRYGQPLAPEGIIVHSTGVDQKRIGAYTGQWNKPGVAVCVHGFLGLDENGELCYEQILPYDIQCWGCGYGDRGSFNHSHIQFEICEDRSNGDWCRETYDAALEICTELCRRYEIPVENVITHSEAHAMGYASNHGDVMHWWPEHGLSMDGFRSELARQLEGGFQQDMEQWIRQQGALPPMDYAAEACRRGVEAGIFSDGDGDGSMDEPRNFVRRQELAVILERLGLI